MYVDDLLVLCDSDLEIDLFKESLERVFPEVTFHSGDKLDYVGMTLDFAAKPGQVVVTMKQSTTDIVTTSGVTTEQSTPAICGLFEVDKSSPRLPPGDAAHFRTFVAKSLYLAKLARPDILAPISFLTTRVNESTTEDLTNLHRVIGYLKSDTNRGIVIDVGPSPIVKAYIDVSYAIHSSDGRSHTGGYLVYGRGGPVLVTSVKQSIVTKSSTEAELVAMSDFAPEAIKLRSFVIAQGQQPAPAIIYQDNKASIALIDHGAPCSKRSRHIDIKRFWLAEKVIDMCAMIEWCPTSTMWANLLTKPLPGIQFLAERMGPTNWQ